MFSNADKISIRDAAINNVGGDLTIINNYAYPGPELVSTRYFCVPYPDDLLGWIIVVSFKPFIPLVRFIFGNYYAYLMVLAWSNSIFFRQSPECHMAGCRFRHPALILERQSQFHDEVIESVVPNDFLTLVRSKIRLHVFTTDIYLWNVCSPQ